jgi:hypothetical protein
MQKVKVEAREQGIEPPPLFEHIDQIIKVSFKSL